MVTKKKGSKWPVTARALFLSFLLLFSYTPTFTEASYQNPSLEEISQKIEHVAAQYQIPAEILKAIAYVESGWRQWDSNGRVVSSGKGSRPNLGMMQVSSYNPADTQTVNRLKYDIDFNIAYGAEVLLSKWAAVPQIGDGDKLKLENWYFALWAYNGWSTVNNPHTAASRGRTAYQDKLLKTIGTAYYGDLTPPVQVTPVPPSSIPAGALPNKKVAWPTPTPVHYGSTTITSELSRGSQPMEVLYDAAARIGGVNRIDTSAQVALTGWPVGSQTVLIAQAEDYTDALAAVSLAKKEGAPILLTEKDSLDRRVEHALNFLQPDKVILLGGVQVLNASVASDIERILPNAEIQRIIGRDRYETAAVIAMEFSGVDQVALVSGESFPDALSLAMAAAAQGTPLLLAEKDSLPQSTKEALDTLRPSSILIAGSEGVLSQSVVNEALRSAHLSSGKAHRYAGTDRYDTSAQIMHSLFPVTGKIYAVSGENLPDALVGAALAAQESVPMIYTPSSSIEKGSSLEQYLRSLPAQTEIEVFGGVSTVSDQIVADMKELLSEQ